MKKLYENIKSGKIEIVENPDPLCKPDGILVKTLYFPFKTGGRECILGFTTENLIGKAKTSHIKEQIR